MKPAFPPVLCCAVLCLVLTGMSRADDPTTANIKPDRTPAVAKPETPAAAPSKDGSPSAVATPAPDKPTPAPVADGEKETSPPQPTVATQATASTTPKPESDDARALREAQEE